MWVGTEMEKKIWFYYTDVRQCPTHKNLRYSISLIFTKIWFIFQQEGNYEKTIKIRLIGRIIEGKKDVFIFTNPELQFIISFSYEVKQPLQCLLLWSSVIEITDTFLSHCSSCRYLQNPLTLITNLKLWHLLNLSPLLFKN